ncbi:alcohol dehydrogenase catalytic domain-containing protein [Streptomyces sp. NPDC001312]|uniref:alcohol dehydrogenase catalytic domain-containing protein n=1 Tax=Streptomyces sp. NPDC001312 TaxID=3364561 RepID=UPI0036BCACE6
MEEVTPGHEPAGTIAEVGARVPYRQPGRRAVIAPGRACGACPHCGDAPGCLAPDDGAELGLGPGRGLPLEGFVALMAVYTGLLGCATTRWVILRQLTARRAGAAATGG